MTRQLTSTILMIQPVKFGYNALTATSNAFQKQASVNMHEEKIQAKALEEFESMVQLLRKAEVEVLVVEDTPEPHTPDSIFPNNWVSFHEDGEVVLYPMEAKNRRPERRKEIIEGLQNKFEIKNILDLSFYEEEEKFLEGTGSLILDRPNKIAYACYSSRTNPDVLTCFTQQTGIKVIGFRAVDAKDKAIYHTNVMMSIGEMFAIVCLDAIQNPEERKQVIQSLKHTGKEIIDISLNQMNQFAGNMLAIKNKQEEKLLIMSEAARNSLEKKQIDALDKYVRLLHTPLATIESNGGGSARCMMAEIFLPEK